MRMSVWSLVLQSPVLQATAVKLVVVSKAVETIVNWERSSVWMIAVEHAVGILMRMSVWSLLPLKSVSRKSAALKAAASAATSVRRLKLSALKVYDGSVGILMRMNVWSGALECPVLRGRAVKRESAFGAVRISAKRGNGAVEMCRE